MYFVGSRIDIDAQAKKDGVISTLIEYAQRNKLIDPSLPMELAADAIWESPIIREHSTAIQEVLAVEVAQYAFRRSNCYLIQEWDILPNLRDRLIEDYERKTGYRITTGNTGRLS